jgi:hypothetical protein
LDWGFIRFTPHSSLPVEQSSLREVREAIEYSQDVDNKRGISTAQLTLLTYNINRPSSSPAQTDISNFLPHPVRFRAMSQQVDIERVSYMAARDYATNYNLIPPIIKALLQEWHDGLIYKAR